jgi:hypothetical protein
VSTTEEGEEGERGKQPITPEAVSKVREGDPNRLRKRLQGDLDSILLTALRKEPARRYSTVEAFSADLRRHLDNLPVSAREDSLWYRANRFARRNPVGVTAGFIVALLMAAGLGTAIWGVRLTLQAGQGSLPGSTITAPLKAVFLCCTLAILAVSVYLTRAIPLRVAGALAGGVPVAFAMMAKLRLGYSIGWWRSHFAETPDPMSLFSAVSFLAIALSGTAYLLLWWRVSRRFGWAGLIVFLIAMSGQFAVQDRFVWDPALNIATVGIYPLMTDAAFWVVGGALGYTVMRLIAGPARSDCLARTR